MHYLYFYVENDHFDTEQLFQLEHELSELPSQSYLHVDPLPRMPGMYQFLHRPDLIQPQLIHQFLEK